MNQTKVIVLDDEPGITALCDRILTGEGNSVQTFVDPVSAIAFMRNNPADLLWSAEFHDFLLKEVWWRPLIR